MRSTRRTAVSSSFSSRRRRIRTGNGRAAPRRRPQGDLDDRRRDADAYGRTARPQPGVDDERASALAVEAERVPPVEAPDVEAARGEGQRDLPAVRVAAEDEVHAARGRGAEIRGVVREQDRARRRRPLA